MFFQFLESGKRLMKHKNIMEELEGTIQDKGERDKVLEGLLGYIMSCTHEAARGATFRCICREA
ncbi:unnamed protein product [Linum tenue]|uniref:Sucrose synthase N-terminal domain-containing protein n=1 Tax=Linum tenue TaxID=586396 RepID=A0AAV0H6G7_9ROSI|nr:unnamed protein product [Linum tenue]